ncbi:hypothetical protein KOR42_28000 [Thalassoglobus neptunius]|uniref:Peptidase C39-like domain-containing protein n=1 Tax=Thalassoglobus neptunius TaxID=1938619 RepID=A0A5C5WWT7_9PLAN|nr:hypothetical protein [Thalassoglobus neptunius]TWT55414.1 hypothetical protein KOR42_28000 [Thalassoglobus neptunius]
MAWFSRFTRFGDVHLCFAQEQNISCGLACIIMAAFKINKLKPKVTAMYGEDDMMAKAKTLFGANPLGDAGLTGNKMISLLNDDSLNMKGWTFTSPNIDQMNNEIVKNVGVSEGWGPTVSVSPVIILVQWKGGTSRHWVLIDTVRKFWGSTYATVCDPWDGSVHVIKIDKDRRFDYAARDTIDVDFWGKRKRYGSKTQKASSTITTPTWVGSVMLKRTT